MATDIVLNNVVIRYPHLDAPWASSPQYTPAYNCQLILPSDFAQWDALQACVTEAIGIKFGASPPAQLKLPWLNKFLQPNTTEDLAGTPYQGCYYINASDSKRKPDVLDGNNQPIPDLQLKSTVFSGCIVNAWVGFYGYQQGGVGTGLNAIQLVSNQDVAQLPDGRGSATDKFQAIPGAPQAIAPAPFSPQDPSTVKPIEEGGW